MRRVLAQALVATLISLLAPRPAAAQAPLQTDYQASWIEIVGQARGFTPAKFRFAEFAAQIEIATETPRLASARLAFDYRDLTSGSRFKDSRIHRWLEAETYPEGRFVMEEIEPATSGHVAIGPLLLHGQEAPMQLVHTLSIANGRIVLDGQANIDYHEWGLPLLRILIFAVPPPLQINLHIEGHLPPAEPQP